MEGYKGMLQSRSVWSGIVAGIAFLLNTFGVGAAFDQTEVVNAVLQIVQGVGILLAVWFRITATKEIKVGGDKLPVILLLAMFAPLLGGCSVSDGATRVLEAAGNVLAAVDKGLTVMKATASIYCGQVGAALQQANAISDSVDQCKVKRKVNKIASGVSYYCNNLDNTSDLRGLIATVKQARDEARNALVTC